MWDGVFLPLQKTVSNVEFVPLLDMSNEQWDILEFEYLRSVAKERIAGMIEAGELVGFFHVNVAEKALKTGKHNYLWPVNKQLMDRFMAEGGHAFFKQEADLPEEGDAAGRVDYLVALANILPPDVVQKLISQLVEMFPQDADAQRLEAKAAVLDKKHKVFLVIILMSRHMSHTEIETLLERVA